MNIFGQSKTQEEHIGNLNTVVRTLRDALESSGEMFSNADF